jgi:hypothetical protein
VECEASPENAKILKNAINSHEPHSPSSKICHLVVSLVEEQIGAQGKKYFPLIFTTFVFLGNRSADPKFTCSIIGNIDNACSSRSSAYIAGEGAIMVIGKVKQAPLSDWVARLPDPLAHASVPHMSEGEPLESGSANHDDEWRALQRGYTLEVRAVE